MISASNAEIQSSIFDILKKIAPEIDPSIIDPTADIRYEFEIDSMDFLRMIVDINELYGIDIPEAEYGNIGTLDNLVDYIQKTQ